MHGETLKNPKFCRVCQLRKTLLSLERFS